jgi:hypothetical protein
MAKRLEGRVQANDAVAQAHCLDRIHKLMKGNRIIHTRSSNSKFELD